MKMKVFIKIKNLRSLVSNFGNKYTLIHFKFSKFRNVIANSLQTWCFYRNNSQGTQVNFNVSTFSRNLFKNQKVDKDIQCTCRNVVELSTTEDRCELNPLKESHSPLVIISVYPKQCSEEIIEYTSDSFHKRANTDNHGVLI